MSVRDVSFGKYLPEGAKERVPKWSAHGLDREAMQWEQDKADYPRGKRPIRPRVAHSRPLTEQELAAGRVGTFGRYLAGGGD